MTSITLLIPVPTSTNKLHTADKRRTPEYSKWLEDAGWEVRIQLGRAARKRLGPGPWWSCLHLSSLDKADPDNRLKSCHDLLVGLGVVPDDRLLRGGTYEKVDAVKKGTAIITVMDERPGGGTETLELRGVVT